jgi:hypothetical protein
VDSISLVAEGWTVHDVGRARTFRDRWAGLKRTGRHRALLIPTRSVHGFGLRSPVLAVGISTSMTVTSVRLLGRGRILYFPGARFVVELPHDAEAPRVGSVVEIRHG